MAITRPLYTLSDEVIFSCVASSVIRVVQKTWPSDRRSFLIRPSGAAAYTAVRSLESAGVAFVICDEPARCEYADGVNRQRTRPVPASSASVLPYVVVNRNASRPRTPFAT